MATKEEKVLRKSSELRRRDRLARFAELHDDIIARETTGNEPYETEDYGFGEAEESLPLVGFPCPVMNCGGNLVAGGEDGFVCLRCGVLVRDMGDWSRGMSVLCPVIRVFERLEDEMGGLSG